jgi:hypothetical protein
MCFICSLSHVPLSPWLPCSMHQILHLLLICLCTYSTTFTFCSLPSPVSCPTYFVFFSPVYSSRASTVQVWHCKASTSPQLLLTVVEPTSIRPALSSSNWKTSTFS